MNSILLFILPFLLAGCMMVGPDYQPPEIEPPQAWRNSPAEAAELVNLAWWQQLEDPVLDGLIEEALQQNKDLRIATARVDQFLGLYGITRSSLYPQVGAEGFLGRERVSEELNPGASTIGNPDDIYQAFLTASWEIDLWGKLRRATEAAQADLLAAEEARKAVILTLVSTVASGYIDLLRFDRQLVITENTIESRRETLELFNQRHDGGVVSNFELSQIRSEYHDALATLPQIKKAIGQQEHAISVLLGRNPGQIARGGDLEHLVLLQIPVGLPSELLIRRPDIRQAEQQLISANANIGVARAAYFPTISLTGFLGGASRDLGDLLDSDARAWNFSANATVPIFTAGRIAGEVRAAEAVQQQSLIFYEQSIQNAFREVEDALVDQQNTREQLKAQEDQIEALQDYARLARLRYDEGYSSYLEVLDSERSLFNVELNTSATRSTLLRSLVNLYKALGGGWVEEADRLSQPIVPDTDAGDQSSPTKG